MSRSRCLMILGFAVVANLPEARSADLPPPKGYVCEQAKTPVKIDGKLDDPAWKDAPWTDDFQDILGTKKPLPRFRTRAKMLWDDTYFYVAAELMEPHVWGTLTKHDSVIFQDNDFEIFIDPDSDNQEYYELEINVLNTEWDLFLGKAYRDGGPVVNSWEVPGLKTATHVNGTLNDPTDKDVSWTVEWAIPWKVLAEYAHKPSPPRNGDQWRVNFSRVEWEHTVEGKTYKKVPNRPEDNWVWSPQAAIDMHRPETWGYVQFSTEAPGVAKYLPDASAPIRDKLMEIYRAERAHHDKNKVWTADFKDLGLTLDPGMSPPEIKLTKSGFEAAILLEGKVRRLITIREDSKIAQKEAGSTP